MAGSPHHVYMAPLGVLYALVGAIYLFCIVLILNAARLDIQRLMTIVRPRLARHLRVVPLALSARVVTRTALVLAGFQMSLYLVQENLEFLTMRGVLPGFSVLFAPPHLTVVPLHLLAALCGSVVLWIAAEWLGRSRRIVQLARVLVGIVLKCQAPAPRLTPAREHVPNRRCVAGVLGLRSPPHTA
jgi:hypothetical protein